MAHELWRGQQEGIPLLRRGGLLERSLGHLPQRSLQELIVERIGQLRKRCPLYGLRIIAAE